VHHAALAHLVVTSQDGGFFRHVHPLRTAPGRVEVRLAADRPGRYLAHTEIERVDAGGQLVSGTFEIGGVASAASAARAAPAAWTFPHGRPATIEVDTGRTGLQSWLGMAGHLIVRDEAGGFLGHVHERGAMSASSDGTVAGHDPVLRFTLSFPRPGRYFAWLQYAEDFRIVTVPYVVEVGDAR
jgi:FtsP/CotA-like multicopper oxidase with cupredoxin domain